MLGGRTKDAWGAHAAFGTVVENPWSKLLCATCFLIWPSRLQFKSLPHSNRFYAAIYVRPLRNALHNTFQPVASRQPTSRRDTWRKRVASCAGDVDPASATRACRERSAEDCGSERCFSRRTLGESRCRLRPNVDLRWGR